MRKYSIHEFYWYLSGYGYADIEFNGNQRANEPLQLFWWFISKHYGVTKTVGWDEMLLSFASSEAEALDLFWQHWDKFKDQQSQPKG